MLSYGEFMYHILVMNYLPNHVIQWFLSIFLTSCFKGLIGTGSRAMKEMKK